jgi:hypothetical protein
MWRKTSARQVRMPMPVTMTMTQPAPLTGALEPPQYWRQYFRAGQKSRRACAGTVLLRRRWDALVAVAAMRVADGRGAVVRRIG